MRFRDLKANEIDCRIGQIFEEKGTPKGLTLLLYKDARVDMDILDETVGASNWQRTHTRDNANCIVSIWDSGKSQWISKEDTGTESYTEKEKGLASDSFKRACVNWGIGRELYTAPVIWVKAEDCNITPSTDKKPAKCSDKFTVEFIEIENKQIVGLTIFNNKTKKTVFSTVTTLKPKTEPQGEQPKPMTLEEAREYKFTSNGKELVVGDLTEEQLIYLKENAKSDKLREAVILVLGNI